MTLIKCDDKAQVDRVRPFGAAPAAPAAATGDPRLLSALAQVAERDAALAEAQARIAKLQAGVVQAHRDGVAEGRAEERAQVQDQDDRRLAALGAALDKAGGGLSATLDGLERLALRLALEAVDKILGDPEHALDRLARAIRRQVDAVEARVLIGVSVSQADFPDRAELEALEHAVARPGLSLTASRDLGPGDCEMRLRLGTVEIGPRLQWSRLAQAFEVLASEAPAP